MDLKRFIQDYTEQVYHAGDAEAAERFIADPCIRHEHGHRVVMSLAENKARIAGFFAGFGSPRFTYIAELADGDLYSAAYQCEFTNAAGTRETLSGIEIFRIEGGKITETWNPAAGQGPWG
ncbi:MAG: nuclear transport factor 2 family protein [Dehalococcoidia bacterium]